VSTFCSYSITPLFRANLLIFKYEFFKDTGYFVNYFTVLVVSTSGTSNEAESTDIESTWTAVESAVDTEAGVSTFLQLTATKAITANTKITFFMFLFLLISILKYTNFFS
jgi:hypothetical protein